MNPSLTNNSNFSNPNSYSSRHTLGGGSLLLSCVLLLRFVFFTNLGIHFLPTTAELCVKFNSVVLFLRLLRVKLYSFWELNTVVGGRIDDGTPTYLTSSIRLVLFV
jgi:hypothetical protein